jgi:hypothetical protein
MQKLFPGTGMETYIVFGGGVGLGLLIAAWGIWKLR